MGNTIEEIFRKHCEEACNVVTQELCEKQKEDSSSETGINPKDYRNELRDGFVEVVPGTSVVTRVSRYIHQVVTSFRTSYSTTNCKIFCGTLAQIQALAVSCSDTFSGIEPTRLHRSALKSGIEIAIGNWLNDHNLCNGPDFPPKTPIPLFGDLEDEILARVRLLLELPKAVRIQLGLPLSEQEWKETWNRLSNEQQADRKLLLSLFLLSSSVFLLGVVGAAFAGLSLRGFFVFVSKAEPVLTASAEAGLVVFWASPSFGKPKSLEIQTHVVSGKVPQKVALPSQRSVWKPPKSVITYPNEWGASPIFLKTEKGESLIVFPAGMKFGGNLFDPNKTN